MEGGGTITVSVHVAAAPPAAAAPPSSAAPPALAAPPRPSPELPRTATPVATPGAPSAPPALARTGLQFDHLVVLALALILLGTVIVTAARTRLEQSHA